MDAKVILLACFGALVGPSAAAQFICEPAPRQAKVVFELGVSALVESERHKIASTIVGAAATSVIHARVEPRTSLLEGLGTERRSLARSRGEYIRDFLIRAGIQPANVVIDLDYSLSYNRTEDHADDRTTYVEVLVFERPGGVICRSTR